MNTRYKSLQLVSWFILSANMVGCGDDGNDGTGGVDNGNEAGVDASASTSEPGDDAGVETASSAASSSTLNNSSSTTGSSSSAGNSTAYDAGVMVDSGDDATGSSGNATSDVDTSSDTSSTTGGGTESSGSNDSGLDAGVDTSVDAGIEDPTSEDIPGTTGPYWTQAFWQGHAEPIGETTVLTVEDGQLCFSGNESGTVGFWYNINQPQGGAIQSFRPVITGVNLDITTPGDYELHFYADEILYCSGVIDETFTYFLWGSFRECTDLFAFYDAETPLTTVRFTYDAKGAFDVCVNRLDSGLILDSGVVDGGVSTDGGVRLDSGLDTDAAMALPDADLSMDGGDAATADASVL